MRDIVKEFFTKEIEDKVNEQLLYYSFSKDEVWAYINEINGEPLEIFMDYVYHCAPPPSIDAKDVVQFSSFKDATIVLCADLKENNNPGMKYKEIGRMLLDGQEEKKEAAYIKYGENHIKTANVLGLVFEFYNTYYLSGIGYVYDELEEQQREKLLQRLILRSKLVMRVLQASQNGTVHMREFLYMLSDSTYVRRRSNVKKLFDVLARSNEYDFKRIVEMLRF